MKISQVLAELSGYLHRVGDLEVYVDHESVPSKLEYVRLDGQIWDHNKAEEVLAVVLVREM